MTWNLSSVGFANGALDWFVGAFAPLSSLSLVNPPQIRLRGLLERVSFYRFRYYETHSSLAGDRRNRTRGSRLVVRLSRLWVCRL